MRTTARMYKALFILKVRIKYGQKLL